MRAFDTYTTSTINRDSEPLGETDDSADSQTEKPRRPRPRMKAREQTAGDGTKLYCSNVKRAIHCPYTDKLVSITDTCTGCDNIYKDDPYYFYCIRGDPPKVNDE